MTVMKGIPMTYNKDLQEDKECVFDSISTTEKCLLMMQRVLVGLNIDPVKMHVSAGSGFLNATELADYLVSKNMPFREAHGIVGKIVVRASELGLALEDLPLREFQSFSPFFDKDLYPCLKLEKAVSRRKEQGGTSPVAVRQAIRALRRRIAR